MGVSPRDFERMQSRVGGARRSPSPAIPSLPKPFQSDNQVVLGIDPSLRSTGYGIIRVSRPSPECITFGNIDCPSSWEHSRCLAKIASSFRSLLLQFKPTVCAVEGLFFAQNLKTAIVMGEARGAAMAMVAEAGLDIYEISPRKAKLAIVGYGAAQKLAMAKMVQRLLRLPDLPPPDAADALALALALAQSRSQLGMTGAKRV